MYCPVIQKVSSFGRNCTGISHYIGMHVLKYLNLLNFRAHLIFAQSRCAKIRLREN